MLRERRDDTTRTVTTYGPTGQVTSTRPYATTENTAADAAAAAAIEQAAAEAKAAEDRAILDAIAHTSATAHVDGQAWTQPTGAHDAYPLGARVTHNGKTWTSTAAANVWPPGTGALWTDDGPV
ncbi:MAG: hypothetical protein E6R04_05280 [Spirochaetes bacterium]|nr:MAG: hypothetical protein E6R04_05280 [Spirochaetota bacterium]